MEQMTLPLQMDTHQFWCEHEMQCVDMDDNGNLKSCCDLTVAELGRPTWTNCRVWGSCTLVGDSA